MPAATAAKKTRTMSLLKNIMIPLSGLAVATAFAFLFFYHVPENSANIAPVYILALIVIVRYTDGYLPGLISSVVAVVCVNFLFTYPYFELNFTLSGYPITFLEMLGVTLLTCTMTTNMKQQARMIAEKDKLLSETEKEILSVTRIHDQSSAVKKTDESVEEIVSAAINRLKKRIPEASVNVSVPDDLLILPMDAILIEQVLINLLENAIIHSQSRKPILCYVDDGARNVTFHVKDFGIGIDPERLKNIFDGNSYIGNSESDSKKGMGIGLSICKTIITAHQGTINARNHEQGAEFYFTLPKGE